MKIKMPISILFFLIFSVIFLEARPKVVVMDFSNPSGYGSDFPIGPGLSQIVRQRLMDSGKVQIVDRESLNVMKEELKLAEDPFFDPSTFPEKGGFRGADFLIRGKVLDFGHFSKDTQLGTLGKLAGGFSHTKTTAYVRLGIEVINLKTATIVCSETTEGRHEKTGTILLGGDLKKALGAYLKLGSSEFDRSMLGKATQKAMAKLLPNVINIFVFEAKILAVSPEGFVIDMGMTSGLKVGQKGRVFSIKEIRNSKGKIVWSSKTQKGEATIIELQNEDALMKSQVAEGISEGDVVLFNMP